MAVVAFSHALEENSFLLDSAGGEEGLPSAEEVDILPGRSNNQLVSTRIFSILSKKSWGVIRSTDTPKPTAVTSCR